MSTSLSEDTPSRSRLLLAAVLVAGFVSVALEGIAFRAMAPFFGTSPHVSSVIVGVVLLGLSIGYYVGGRLSRHGRVHLGHVAAATGIWVVGVATMHERVLEKLTRFGFVKGSLFAALALFLPPMIVLSMACPLVIGTARADERESAGATLAGRVYSVSTLGSIAGIFASTFLLLPALGVARSFALAAALLFLIYAFVAKGPRIMAQRACALAGVLVVFPLVGYTRPAPPPDLVVEVDSAYSRLRVTRGSEGRMMLSVNNTTEQSFNRPHPWVYWESDPRSLLTLGAGLNGKPRESPRSIAVIGLCTGYGAAELAELYTGDIHGVEIDPQILSLGRQYFGLDAIAPGRLHTHAEDGRRFLLRSTTKYDAILMDAFRGEFLPYHLTTREYFELVRDRLAPDGVLGVHVAYPALRGQNCHNPLLDIIGRSMRAAGLGPLLCADTFSEDPDYAGASVLYFVNTPGMSVETAKANLEKFKPPPEAFRNYMNLRDYTLERLHAYDPGEGEVSTDDRSRAEEIAFEGWRGLIGKQ